MDMPITIDMVLCMLAPFGVVIVARVAYLWLTSGDKGKRKNDGF